MEVSTFVMSANIFLLSLLEFMLRFMEMNYYYVQYNKLPTVQNNILWRVVAMLGPL